MGSFQVVLSTFELFCVVILFKCDNLLSDLLLLFFPLLLVLHRKTRDCRRNPAALSVSLLQLSSQTSTALDNCPLLPVINMASLFLLGQCCWTATLDRHHGEKTQKEINLAAQVTCIMDSFVELWTWNALFQHLLTLNQPVGCSHSYKELSQTNG